jgi:P-type Cu2+ transporter
MKDGHPHDEMKRTEHGGHEMTHMSGNHQGMDMSRHTMHMQGQPDMPQSHGSHHSSMISDFKRRFWISLVITVPILILSPFIQDVLGLGEALRFSGDMYVLWALSSVVFFYGGYPFLAGLGKELRSRLPGMMTLIGLAIAVAYAYSSAVAFGLKGEIFFWELATLVDIMLLGHWIEMRSILGASRALEELARLMPSVAHKLMPDRKIMDIPLAEIMAGDQLVVRPGEKIPADGVVIDGESSVNEAMLTGESAPISKESGIMVIGGSVNGDGSLTVEVQKTGNDSYLSQVINLVRQAQESKSRTQDLASRAALWLTIIALSTGAITIFIWLAVLNRDFAFSLERMVTVLVICCPHALGLAVPLVVAVSTAIAARKGLLIRDRNAFELARNIQAILFDKTGTLTEGKFGVTDTITLKERITVAEMLKYAGSLEAYSEHPIARGISSATADKFPVEGFRSIPGKGAEATVNGQLVSVVSPGYLRENNLQAIDERIDKVLSQGKTVVYVIIGGEVAGAIALADVIRPESKLAISKLKEMGIKCMMITGDNSQVAKWVSGEIGLDEYFAEILPDRKAAMVKEVQSRGLLVAMTGDGVNDAPALAQSDVGIAIGAGTDVAAEAADIILVRSNPLDVVAIIGLAKATYGKMMQNLLWATGYNAVAIPLAAGVLYGQGILLTPAVGAVLMSVSTVIVAINARLLKVDR